MGNSLSLSVSVSVSIDTLVSESAALLEVQHQARETALVLSRTLVRQCARAIRACHRTSFPEAVSLLEEATTTADTLHQTVAAHPELIAAGYTQDAFKEYAEAALVYAFLTNTPPPSATTLNIHPAAYLNGLAEAASELRRAILDRIRHEHTAEISSLLDIMDEVCSLLMTVDYPEAVTSGLRRSTDALRSVVERTRGDVTAALRQDKLMDAIKQMETQLE
jgi:translin